MIERVWYRVPVRVLKDRELTACDVGVLALICDRADNSTCKISASKIAEELEISTRTVKRAIAKLEEKKYIEVIRHSGGASEFKQLILESKKRNQPKNSTSGKGDQSVDHSLDKYKQFINDFGIGKNQLKFNSEEEDAG